MADTSEIVRCDHCGEPVRRFKAGSLRWDNLTGSWVHDSGIFSCQGNLLGNNVATVNGRKR